MTWICVAPTLILGRAFSKGYTTNFPKMPTPPFLREQGARKTLLFLVNERHVAPLIF